MDDGIRDNLPMAGPVAAEARRRALTSPPARPRAPGRGGRRPSPPTRLIGSAIERAIESSGFKPISNLTGHTIERYHLHAGKSIPNVGGLGSDVVEAGDTIAIEPFSTNGGGEGGGREAREIQPGPSSPGVAPPAPNQVLRENRSSLQGLPFAERWAFALD